MNYHELLDAVRRHVERQGVECEIYSGEPASEQALALVESKLGIRFPDALREFYLTVGDGYQMYWQADPNDEFQPFCCLEIPELTTIYTMCKEWRELALFTPEKGEEYGFPGTADPELAKRTAARMWHWLPIIHESNGDHICIDLSVPRGPVVFHQHDWYDGGTGDDGHLLAPSWSEFLMGWGRVCFQFPHWVSWRSCFPPGGGVAWDEDCFRSPFRMADKDAESRDHN